MSDLNSPKYRKGDIVGIYGNAFNNQGVSIPHGVIRGYAEGTYEIEAEFYFYWRTEVELDNWGRDHMRNIIPDMVRL